MWKEAKGASLYSKIAVGLREAHQREAEEEREDHQYRLILYFLVSNQIADRQKVPVCELEGFDQDLYEGSSKIEHKSEEQSYLSDAELEAELEPIFKPLRGSKDLTELAQNLNLV